MAKRKEKIQNQETYPNSGVMTNKQLQRLLEAEGWVEYPLGIIRQRVRNYLVDQMKIRINNIPDSLIVVPLEGDMVEVIRGSEFDQYYNNPRELLELIKNNGSRFYGKLDNSRT